MNPIVFDNTINLGNVASTIIFVIGIGIYVGKLQVFMKHAEKFFEESYKDRKEIRKTMNEQHVENVKRLATLEAKVETQHPYRSR